VQCLGILIFYLDLAFLKKQFTFVARSFKRISSQNLKRYLVLAFLGIIVVIIGSCATIILLIAILLPGFTLGVYVDVTSLVENRANLWILVLLVSQFIWMQCLQSIMSRKLTRRFGIELLDRLKYARSLLTAEDRVGPEKEENGMAPIADNIEEMEKKIKSLVIESRIHVVTRSHLAGLFPTYSIGINIKEILILQELKNLSAMFRQK
jgi:hypothetical protein